MSLPEVPFRVLRGQPGNQAYYTYRVPLTEGMVVLDAMHYIQAHYAGDLRYVGTARRANAGLAAPRSTAGRPCYAVLGSMPCSNTERLTSRQ